MISIDATLLAFASGSLIPFVTALLTKVTAPSGVKAVCSAVLAGITAVLIAIQHAGGVIGWKQALIVFLETEIAMAATYYGFSKPTGIAPALHSSTGTFGLG